MATTNIPSIPPLPNQTSAPATGLMGATTQPTGAPFTQAGAQTSSVAPNTQASQMQATLQSVDQGQTTAGRLDSMLAADSPYIQRAQTKANEFSNKRGLMNSSMAAGAGTAAAIDAAAPIAQADSNLFADSRNRNQDAINSTGQFNTSQANQFALADKGIQADIAKAATQQGYTQANMALGTQQDIQKLGVQQGYTQANLSTQQGYDLAKMDKQAAQTLQQMDAGLVLDLQKMAKAQGYQIETMNAQQINDLSKMATAKQFDLEKMAAANGFTKEQLAAATVQDLQKMAAANGYDLDKMAKQQGFNLEAMSKQQVLDLAKMDKTYSLDDLKAQAKFGYDKELTAMQQSAAKDIAGIESKYKNLTQTSASATSITNNASNMINSILLNEKLTGDSTTPDPQNPGKFLSNKQLAIDQVKANMEQSLAMIGALAGDVNLTAYFDSLDGNFAYTAPTASASQTPGSQTTGSAVVGVGGAPTPLTPQQNTNIASFWSQNQDNPQAVMQAMTQYGVNAQQLAAATGQSLTYITNYLRQAGAPSGFGGATFTPIAPATGLIGSTAPTPTPTQTPTATQASTEAIPTTSMTPQQVTNIASFWAQNQSNPQAVMQGMTQYGVSASDLAASTGQPLSAITTYLRNAGAPSGFGGVSW